MLVEMSHENLGTPLSDVKGGGVFMEFCDSKEAYIRVQGGDGSRTSRPSAINAKDGVLCYFDLRKIVFPKNNSILKVS